MLFLQRLIERVFAILTIFFYTGAIAPFIPESHPAYPLELHLPNVALMISILLIMARWKRVLSIVIREKILWLVIGIVLVSPLWSELPMVTWERILPLFRVTAFGVYFATRYELDEQVTLIALSLSMATVLSLLFGVALPSYGVMGRGFISNSQDWAHAGAWRGIYIHKVALGNLMSLAGLTFTYMSFKTSDLFWKYFWLLNLFLAMIVLLGSTTKTALVAMVVTLAVIPMYRSLRWNYKILIPMLIFFVLLTGVGLILLVNSLEPLLASLGKDLTLSGRTEFWPIVIDQIFEKPLLGYGYRTFWYGGWEGNAANIWVYLKRGFEPGTSHNGYLETLLSIGCLGFSTLLASLFSAFGHAVMWVRRNATAIGLVPISFLTMLLLLNTTESMLMDGDFNWVCYISIVLSLHRIFDKSCMENPDEHPQYSYLLS